MNGLEAVILGFVVFITLAVIVMARAVVGVIEAVADGGLPDLSGHSSCLMPEVKPPAPPLKRVLNEDIWLAAPKTQSEKDEEFRRRCEKRLAKLSWPGLWW